MTAKAYGLLLAALLIVSGCGRSDGAASSGQSVSPTATAAATTSPAATAPPVVTHGTFVRQLDATCRGSVSDLAREADQAGDDTARLAGIVHRMLARIDPSTRARAKLTAPPTDQAAFRRYQRAQGRIVAMYERLERALRANDLGQVRYLLGLQDRLREARTTAALDLGAKRCGS